MNASMPAKKIKVAVVITKLELGGAQQVALETAKGLNDEAFDCVLISGSGGILDEEAAQALGGKLLLLKYLKHPISPFFDLLAFFWLTFFFLRHRVEIVHTHSSKAGILGRAAAWAAGVPVIIHTVHGWPFHDFMPPLTRKVYTWLERQLALVTSCLVVVARSLEAKGLQRGIGRKGQYRLLRAAVDLGAWRAAGRQRGLLRRQLKLPAGSLVVGTLANCKPQKNPLDFVRVAAKVIGREKKAHFVYIGDGPLRGAAEAEAARLGIAGQVHFLGWREKPESLVAGFDLFLLVSLWEGLPCVFPQTLSLGLPVVASAVDGASEVIQEAENGYLCQAQDVDALSERVYLLLRDRRLRKAMGRRAKLSLGPEWDFSSMVRQSETLYQQRIRLWKERGA